MQQQQKCGSHDGDQKSYKGFLAKDSLFGKKLYYSLHFTDCKSV